MKKKIAKGRVCKKCGLYKNADYFYKDNKYRGGLTSQCKYCLNEAGKRREYDKKMKELRKRMFITEQRYVCRSCGISFEKYLRAKWHTCIDLLKERKT